MKQLKIRKGFYATTRIVVRSTDFIYRFRLAEKAWKEKRDRTAKDILEQTNELIEDLGPVEFRPAMNDDDEWESDEEEMDQN